MGRAGELGAVLADEPGESRSAQEQEASERALVAKLMGVEDDALALMLELAVEGSESPHGRGMTRAALDELFEIEPYIRAEARRRVGDEAESAARESWALMLEELGVSSEELDRLSLEEAREILGQIPPEELPPSEYRYLIEALRSREPVSYLEQAIFGGRAQGGLV